MPHRSPCVKAVTFILSHDDSTLRHVSSPVCASFAWSTVLLAASFVVLGALPGCSLLGGGKLPFPWMEPGARFVYDYRNAGESFADPVFDHTYPDADSAYVLWIEKTDYADTKFDAYYSAWGDTYDIHHIDGQVGVILSEFYRTWPSPQRAREGIVIKYPASCRGSDSFLDRRRYTSAVRVPAHPRQGKQYRYYECGDAVEATYEVLEVGKEITVPAGTFEVFVLHSVERRQREYWSEAEGLIRLDKFHEDGSLLGTYELSSKSR